MALAFLNRCGFRAASSGTGSFVVASALVGMYAPASCANPAVVDGASYRYFAESDDKTQHEEGYGVWDDGTSTLTRAVVLSSSNSNNAVNFSAAPKVFMGGPLAQDMGWSLVSGGEILSPVQYLDLDLPTEFRLFKLFIDGFVINAEDKLAYAFSPDGGATIISDTSNEAYSGRRLYHNFSGLQTAGTTDSIGYLTVNANDLPVSVEVTIFPGEVGKHAKVHSGQHYDELNDSWGMVLTMCAGASGRQNLIRIAPYGNGDIDPPTSGREITSGTYRLLGLR